jgi:putative endonuclease
MSSSNQETGVIGENISERYLLKEGYEILERNFRCRLGEIDIIARRGSYICFVEVKTRHGNFFGNPCEAVNHIKQKRIWRIAEFYIQKNKLFDFSFRFDVIEVVLDRGRSYTLRFIRDAFQI